MLPRHRIVSAHFGFHVLNATNELFLSWQFTQPWTAADILTSLRVNPDIINPRCYLIDPSENIVPAVLFPESNIPSRGREFKSESLTAMTTLQAGKICRWYILCPSHQYTSTLAPLNDGTPSHVRPSNNRPFCFFARFRPSAPQPPHCLKKKAACCSAHWRLILRAHSGFISLAFGPDSPPTMTQ